MRIATFIVGLSVLTIGAVIGLAIATGIMRSEPIMAVPLGSSLPAAVRHGR